MGRWCKVGLLLAGMLVSLEARAQFLSFGQKPPEEPPPAFSNGPAPAAGPEFLADPKHVPPGTPQFCPPMNGGAGQTPFIPVEEENRNAFQDYKVVEPEPFRIWFKGEWLRWNFNSSNLPVALVTTSTAPNAANNIGALQQPNTQVLLGNDTFNFGNLNGARFTGGFAPRYFLPIEVSGFFLNASKTLFSGSGGGNGELLARPVLASQLPNVSPLLPTGVQTALSAGFPGVNTGSIVASASTNLWGIEANIFMPLGASDVLFFDALVGYRYMNLNESLGITNSLAPLSGTIPFGGSVFGPGFQTSASDQFATTNQFNGGNLGLRSGLNYGRVGVLLDTKLGLGAVHEVLNVSGSSTLIPPATAVGTATLPGGVLAVPSNSGSFTRNEFAVVPEIAVNVAFQVHRNIRLFAGYDLLWMTRVVRPGDQLNNVVDTRQVPTSPQFNASAHVSQPAHVFNETDFFANGFNVGVLIGF